MQYICKCKSILYRLIDEENPIARPKTLTWNGYYGLDEIYAWIDEKLAQYPGILTHHIVGKSYQGRDIRAVLLSHKPVTIFQ